MKDFITAKERTGNIDLIEKIFQSIYLCLSGWAFVGVSALIIFGLLGGN